MKRARTSKAGTKPKNAAPAAEEALTPVDLGTLREQIVNLVRARAVGMVESALVEVEKGHYLGMKHLFEMVELCTATSSEKGCEEDSLAKTLLQRLKIPEEISTGTEVTKECDIDPAESASDAVE